jgi:transposase-like protein
MRHWFEHNGEREFDSQSAAIKSIAPKIGCGPDTLRAWVRRAETDIALCEAGCAEFWGIYGRASEGTEDEPLYLATAVHDAITPLEAVRIARQISLETGKGFVAGDDHFGQFPRRNGKLTPVAEFTEIAEDLTFVVHEDIEAKVSSEDRRIDDFDNYPLSELREAFVEFSDFSGSDQCDPYQSIEHVACDPQQQERTGS